jgi:hypothetical protein
VLFLIVSFFGSYQGFVQSPGSVATRQLWEAAGNRGGTKDGAIFWGRVHRQDTAGLEGSVAARRGRCQGGDERDGAREGETRGTSHRLSGGRGRAARRVVAGASIEAGVTKCVRVCWGKTTRCAEDEGEGSGFFIVVQSGEGGAKPHRARQTQRGSAPRRRLPN